MKKDSFVIIEVQGVGYEVFLSESSLERVPKNGQELEIFCYLEVGERMLRLYGFLTFEELELFKLIRSIPGVGPKAALQISSFGSPEKLKKELEKGSSKIFEGLPGIGKKKAQKVVLELSGKLKEVALAQKEPLLEDEALLALVNLGFKKEQARQALGQVPKEIKEIEERVKQALKLFGK